jgi:hypothetical protein
VNRRRVFAVVCWALLTAWLGWRSAVSGSHPVNARTLDADAPPPPSEQERTQERAAVEFQNRQQVAELAKFEKAQQKHTDLLVKQRERLMRLQISLANTWSNVLATNLTVYQELRRKAAGSARKATPCTICDGQGMMHFCIVCENSGKCIDCNGKGKTPYGEPCPACRGKGRCYLCGGAGQMPCVFCDDGLVYSEGVPPPLNLPLPGGTLPATPLPGTTWPAASKQDAVARAAPAPEAGAGRASSDSSEN